MPRAPAPVLPAVPEPEPEPQPEAPAKEESAEVEDTGPLPDPRLAIYNSAKPTVELLPGVPLSALISAAWLPEDARAMLAENWVPVPLEVEYEEGAQPPSSFDPKDAEYNEMARRLSKSAALKEYNKLMIKTKELEVELASTRDEKAKDDLRASLEDAQAELGEVEAQFADLRASFTEDPLSLVPWMQTLFTLADAGMTTFDVSGRFFPFTNIRAVFSSDNNTSYYEGTESVLGMFKRRYELERGPNKIQVLAKLVPNHFQDGYTCQEYVETVVERIRVSVFGPESAEPLDLVQMFWWDVKEHDMLPTLKVLQALSEDKLEVVDAETGEVAISEPKKVRAIGLVDFPPRAILSVIQAGVPVASLQCPFSIADRSHLPSLELAREYGLKVLARDGLMGGLISEKYLGVAPPSTTGPGDSDLDEVAHALELANNYGGWGKVQALLQAVKGVADKHGVMMQTVALRWQIDQGLFPIATMRWNERCWSQFGYYYWNGAKPGVDGHLFQVHSFLDEEDMAVLNALG